MSPHVTSYLKALHETGFDIVFVQNSDTRPAAEAYHSIKCFCRRIINRSNTGYDFYSWKVGIGSAEDLLSYQSLVTTNDSVVGPFTPLTPIIRKMAEEPNALWGMTDCSETGTHHLQSYFIYWPSQILHSEFFRAFWKSVKVLRQKWQIIVTYEAGLSKAAKEAGYPIQAAFPYEKIRQAALKKGNEFQFYNEIRKDDLNPTLYAWDILLEEFGYPFIKTELLRSNRLHLKNLTQWKQLVREAAGDVREAAILYEESNAWHLPKRYEGKMTSAPLLRELKDRHPVLYATLRDQYRWSKDLAQACTRRNISEIKREAVTLLKAVMPTSLLRENILRPAPDRARQQYCESAARELAAFFLSGARLSIPHRDDPVVTIVMILFNKAELTYRCLLSLAALSSEPSFTVLIIDNASSDSTRELLERVDGVEVIRNEHNVGFLKACNQASERVVSEHLLLLNNDTELYPGGIAAAVEVLRNHAVGAVGGRIVLPNGLLQEAGNIFWNDGTCVGYGRGLLPDAEECMFQRDVDYCSGVFLMTRTELYKRLGGFDERYFPAYYEEADFCAQLHQNGYRVVYDPRILVKHVEFGSSGQSSSAFDLMNANRGKFAKKNRMFLDTKRAPNTSHILARSSRRNKKRLLLLDDRAALPKWGAGYPRTNRILHLLTEWDEYEITVGCTEYFEKDWKLVYTDIPSTIEIVDLTDQAKQRRFFKDRLAHYDVVWASRPTNISVLRQHCALDVPATRRFALIYDSEAIFAERALLEAQVFGLDQRPAQKQMLREFENGGLADIIVSVCEADASKWAAATGKEPVVLGFDASVTPAPHNLEKRKDILFLGSMHDTRAPNTDSLFWFMRNVMPLIREKLPQVRVNAVGYVAPAISEQLSRELRNFKLIGAVDDLTPYFQSHRLMIVPTRFAAGNPQKVFDAGVSGIPMVCSTVIAEQMRWRNRVESLVASTDNPRDFADRCLELYNDDDLWTRIYERSLDSLRQYSSTHSIEGGLKKILRKLNPHAAGETSTETRAPKTALANAE